MGFHTWQQASPMLWLIHDAWSHLGPETLLINGLGLGDRTGAEGKGKLNVAVQGPNRKPQPQLLRPAYLKLFTEPVLEVEVGWRGEKGKETAWSLATSLRQSLHVCGRSSRRGRCKWNWSLKIY